MVYVGEGIHFHHKMHEFEKCCNSSSIAMALGEDKFVMRSVVDRIKETCSHRPIRFRIRSPTNRITNKSNSVGGGDFLLYTVTYHSELGRMILNSPFWLV